LTIHILNLLNLKKYHDYHALLSDIVNIVRSHAQEVTETSTRGVVDGWECARFLGATGATSQIVQIGIDGIGEANAV
jgi:hypothetical protein